jgi:hypothetical protein
MLRPPTWSHTLYHPVKDLGPKCNKVTRVYALTDLTPSTLCAWIPNHQEETGRWSGARRFSSRVRKDSQSRYVHGLPV